MREYRLTFEIYKSGFIRKSWKWRAVAPNGRIIAGGHGFNSAQLARDSVSKLIEYIQAKEIFIKLTEIAK